MAVYLYGIKSVKYGVAASSNYMPSGVALTALPNTVRGSVSIEESEGADAKFYVDQQYSPVKVVRTEMGELTATMQFYDSTYASLAAMKGGTGNASGYVPATGFVTVEKAIEIITDAGYKFNIYNASCKARITGGLDII